MTMLASLFDLHGRVAVLTGGAGLLGSRHADTLAGAGANLVIADLDGVRASALAEAVATRHGVRAVGLAADVGTVAGADAVAAAVSDAFGGADILINNVMAKPPGYYASFDAYGLDAWQRTWDGNVTSILLMSQRLVRSMIARGHGSMINIATVYGVVAPDQQLYDGIPNPYAEGTLSTPASYSATKGAVIALTRHLASQFGRTGLRVNALTPGGVQDSQHPSFIKRYADKTMLGRMAGPDDYRGAILFLASDASAYVTGSNLVVDGGFTAW